MKSLVKIKLNLPWDITSKLQTFQSFYSLHKPPHPYWFPLLSSYAFCGQIFENIFFFLDLLVQKLFFDKNHWFQLLSTNNNWIISLLLISVTLHSLSASLSTIPSCLLLAKKLWFSMKTLLLLLTKSPYARKICFLVCFLSFFRFFFFVFVVWSIETTTTNMLGMTPSNPEKCTNQVTLSNEYMKYLFWT